jgi:hypothetical protein
MPSNIYTARFFSQYPGPNLRFLKISATQLLQYLNYYEYLGELGEHFGNADFFQKFGAAAFGEIFWEEISVPGNRRAAFTKP